jgi:hypothetical protein
MKELNSIMDMKNYDVTISGAFVYKTYFLFG